MLNEIFVEKVDNIEFVVKEEKNFGKLNIFINNKLIETYETSVNRIVYLDYSEKNNLLIGSGYENGEVFSAYVENKKKLDSIAILKERDNTDRKSRSHSIIFDRNEKYAYSANIGLDKIYIYEVSEKKLKQISSYSLPENTGPRHMCFNRELDILYVVTENSNEIYAFKQDIFSGELLFLEVKSILNDDFIGESYAQTLTIQKDNRFLLANTRGANTVAVFKILQDGLLDRIIDLDCELFEFYKAKENVYGL